MPRLFLVIALLVCVRFAHAEAAALAPLFSKAGVHGTLVIESFKTGQRFVHDARRAGQAFAAASTFKIPNTLIALEEGVIADADAVIAWDGTHYEMAEWNRDQTLASAFRLSCVWCYQRLARQVGAAKYVRYIHQAHYGHLREPFDVSQFWLDGSLSISAEQQVAFLKQLVARSLPYQARSYDTLKAIMLVETGPGYRLYAKTGWAARHTPGIGWMVGYVEVADDTWLFALNLDTGSAADLPLRPQILREALRMTGILTPAESKKAP